MKYFSRAKIYKAANVSFDPSKVEARSYQWWTFVKKIGPLTVFNAYPYSVTTRKHQSKVRSLLQELGVQIHAEVSTHAGLQNSNWSKDAEALCLNEIDSLKQAMLKGRPAKNLERAARIIELRAKIKQVRHLAKMEGAK